MNSKAFPFHDGYLASVSVGERTAVLGLKQVGGGEFVMTLGGVEALSIDGFREGNIILDLWMVSGKQPTSEDLQTMKLAEVIEVLFPGPHPEVAAQYHQAHAAVLETKLEKVRGGEAALVLLVPAYGADLYAFCASVDLQPPVPPLPLRQVRFPPIPDLRSVCIRRTWSTAASPRPVLSTVILGLDPRIRCRAALCIGDGPARVDARSSTEHRIV